MAFVHEVRVRYAEVDAQGVVFNAHWLTYCDDAVTRFFEHLGYPPKETWSEGGPFDLMLRHCELDWPASAGFDDVVAIEITTARLGTSSFDLAFTARVDGETVVTVATTYVVVVAGEARSQPIPDQLRAALEAHAA